MSITIDGEHRDILWGDAVSFLTGVGDIYVEIDKRNWQKARELRASFERVMRLLDDIGWAQRDPGERFELTIELDELKGTVAMLHRIARDHVEELLTESNVDAAVRSMRGLAEVLDQLGHVPVAAQTEA